MTDIEITDCGSIVQLRPATPAGVEWIGANVESEPWQWMGPCLCVDRRMAGDLIDGIVDAGLTVG